MSKTALLLVLCGALAVAAANTPTYKVVETESGPVRGEVFDGFTRFRGIPYAADTGGENRFMPPKPTESWAPAVRDALEYGPGCWQPDHNPDVPKNQSEDCLNLNVWTPDVSGNYPVMIFIHGGSFKEGSNQGPFDMYKGSVIVNRTRNVVVVNINYRLFVLGFLVTENIPGNMGLLDQRAAFRWVRDNIAAFGGDPTNVTIWGESAGAMSVGIHLVSPGSKGLYHRAIMESNPAAWFYRTPAEMRDYGRSVLKLANCHDVDCLRKVDPLTLTRIADKAAGSPMNFAEANIPHVLDGFLQFIPVVDGVILPKTPMEAFAAGEFHAVPMLLGSNQDEGQTFVYSGLKKPIPVSEYAAAVVAIFGYKAPAILQRYGYNWKDGRMALGTVLTDYLMRCSQEKMLQHIVRAGQPGYAYRFEFIYPQDPMGAFGLGFCANMTCHASELPMVFGFQAIVPKLNFTFTPGEQELSNHFIDYWTSFAVHSNPNHGHTHEPWPVFDTNIRRNIVLQKLPLKQESVKYDDDYLCSFWDEIGYNH
eukprot:PLAT2467.8.p1 GENE.PLAT2467.8~~PLAT2467.8.p1  ORF type:complete len:553 (-),score=255.23 PLAT2467.8:191-1792(-)